jgi:hypothetical protein
MPQILQKSVSVSSAAAPAAEFNKCVDAEKPAVHGSCLRNTRARLVFPVTTVVRQQILDISYIIYIL